MRSKLLYMAKYPLHKHPGRRHVLQRDMVSDGVKIAERRVGPDYFSHRDMRALACA